MCLAVNPASRIRTLSLSFFPEISCFAPASRINNDLPTASLKRDLQAWFDGLVDTLPALFEAKLQWVYLQEAKPRF